MTRLWVVRTRLGWWWDLDADDGHENLADACIFVSRTRALIVARRVRGDVYELVPLPAADHGSEARS